MPRPKPSFEEYKHLFEDMSIELDLTKFNKNTPITIKCEHGHFYKTSITKIMSLNHKYKECPHCKNRYDNFRVSYEQIEPWMNENNLVIVNRKSYYSKWNDLIHHRCNKCGREDKIKSINYFLNNGINTKHMCSGCITKEKIIKQEEIERRQVEFLSVTQHKIDIPQVDFDLPITLREKIDTQSKWSLIEYTSTRTKGKYRCNDCGYDKVCYPHSIFNGRGKGCPNCFRLSKKEEIKNKIIENCKVNNIFPIEDFEHSHKNMKFGCGNCGNIFENKWNNIQSYTIMCPNCNRSLKKKTQHEVSSFISQLGISVEEDNRQIIYPLELDIFIPDKKIAIEYCGHIWHSSKYQKNEKYHLNKLLECEKKGIRLITIFEEEWVDKRNICESRIKSLLGITKTKIGARQCEVSKIENKVALEFCKNNHIQGQGQCCESYGLFYKGTLVSVMTFSKPSIAKGNKSKNSLEINRFCSLLDTQVVGSASKLFTYFIKTEPQIEQIYSYSDLRWGNGKVYEQIGMKLENITRPNYYWVGSITNWKLKHRFNYTKSRLKELFVGTDEDTEETLATKNGLYRIWDCGHKKYTYNLKML